MKKFKLNMDDQEGLVDLLDHYGWEPLLKVIEQLVTDQEQSVLKLDITGGGVEKLVHAKLRAEGARKLCHDISSVKEHYRKKQDR